MIPAIEYLFRRPAAFLTLPCCLFLTDETAVGLRQRSDHVLAKRWILSEGGNIPPFQEFKVYNVFTSPKIIVPGVDPLPYLDDPYEAGVRQYSDYPLAAVQQSEYVDAVENVYNSMAHREMKRDWLWDIFIDSNKIPVRPSPTRWQMTEVELSHGRWWQSWLVWRKHLLDFPGNAPELVFAPAYKFAGEA